MIYDPDHLHRLLPLLLLLCQIGAQEFRLLTTTTTASSQNFIHTKAAQRGPLIKTIIWDRESRWNPIHLILRRGQKRRVQASSALAAWESLKCRDQQQHADKAAPRNQGA